MMKASRLVIEATTKVPGTRPQGLLGLSHPFTIVEMPILQAMYVASQVIIKTKNEILIVCGVEGMNISLSLITFFKFMATKAIVR
jgi:hypothetical protein